MLVRGRRRGGLGDRYHQPHRDAQQAHILAQRICGTIFLQNCLTAGGFDKKSNNLIWRVGKKALQELRHGCQSKIPCSVRAWNRGGVFPPPSPPYAQESSAPWSKRGVWGLLWVATAAAWAIACCLGATAAAACFCSTVAAAGRSVDMTRGARREKHWHLGQVRTCFCLATGRKGLERELLV